MHQVVLDSFPALQTLHESTFPSARRGLIILAATWALWRVFKKFTTVKPLDIVPGPKSESWLSGTLLQIFNPVGWDYHDMLAKKYPGIAKLPSMFGGVMLHVHDPTALYHIMVKDQNIFEETDDFIRVNNLLFGPGLLATLGDHHRKQRKILNPVFSISHMKEMIPIFYSVGHRLRDTIETQVTSGQSEINMLSWMTRTALELVGQSGLGTSFDSLEVDASPHPFLDSMKNLMQTLALFTVSRFIVLPQVVKIGTPSFRRWLVNITPWKKLHKIRDMINVMHETSVQIFDAKKRELANGGEGSGDKKDIISILLKANMTASEEERMPDQELLGQMNALTFAAMDTTSNALSRILSLLSENQDVQGRVRQEILEAKKQQGGSDLLYDQLVQLPLLDAICRETLRLHAPVPFIMRQARKGIMLPLSRPFISTEGKETHEVFVPQDTLLIISIMACNKDPLIWGPDAHEWKPERWLSPLPETVTNAKIPGVYSHLMTFIGGSRACIGFKFSQLEMKVVLCLLLESFRFTPTDKKIVWQFNGVAQPSVEDLESAGPTELQLPLNVALCA